MFGCLIWTTCCKQFSATNCNLALLPSGFYIRDSFISKSLFMQFECYFVQSIKQQEAMCLDLMTLSHYFLPLFSPVCRGCWIICQKQHTGSCDWRNMFVYLFLFVGMRGTVEEGWFQRGSGLFLLNLFIKSILIFPPCFLLKKIGIGINTIIHICEIFPSEFGDSASHSDFICQTRLIVTGLSFRSDRYCLELCQSE